MITTARIRPIIKKEFRQVLRDRRSLGALLVIPAFMLVMFGYALNYDVKHIALAVLDQDQSTESRAFAAKFFHSEYFDRVDAARIPAEIEGALQSQQASAAIVITRGFGRSLVRHERTSIQVIVDGANATAATVTVGYVTAITQQYAARIEIESVPQSYRAAFGPPVDFRPRIWYNPELKSAKFLVPGLIGFILLISTVISTSMSIVREREKGTMEQINVSPIMPIELLIGKTAPYILISLVSTVLVLVTGNLLFDVVVRGSYLWLFVATLLFILCGLGIGMFVSTVSSTQEEAFMLSVTVSLLPTFMLSGFTFPIANMPEIIQGLTYINPARYFLSSIRVIILKGVGAEVFWKDLVFMSAFALLVTTLSWRKMTKAQLQ